MSIMSRFAALCTRTIMCRLKARMPPRKPDRAVFGPGAILMEEGIIENCHGNSAEIYVGEKSIIRGRLLTYGHGGKITIGEWCYIGVRSEIWSMDHISIGNRVLIAHDVNIHDGTAHSMDPVQRHEHFKYIYEEGHPKSWGGVPGIKSKPIVIEDDVWINFGVTILKGVRIGKGSIIAAGSMVTKDVPPGVLYRCEVRPIITPLNNNQETNEVV